MNNKQIILWVILLIVVIASTIITIDAYAQPIKIVEKVKRVEVPVTNTVEVLVFEKLEGIDFEITAYCSCEITAYCSCEICTGQWSDGITATGTKVKEGRTIAVDPEVIPLGSKVVIEGFDTVFIAEDTGNPKYMSGKRIDIYMADHDKALEFGRVSRKVWVIE